MLGSDSPPPTPPSFPLDFKQLLQATTADPASRTRPCVRSGTGVTPLVSPRRNNCDRITEEDEWDLVEDAV